MSKTPKNSLEFEVINGIKISKNMPKKQREALLNDTRAANPQFDAESHIKNVKTRITLAINCDLLRSIRKEAEKVGLPYQTYINHLLKDFVGKQAKKNAPEDRIWSEVMLNFSRELSRANTEREEAIEELKKLKIAG